MVETTVYVLCGILSVICAASLFRRYQRVPSGFLLWSSLAFIGMAINNIVLVLDMVILPNVDISGPLLRNVVAGIAGSLLLFGLIWELT